MISFKATLEAGGAGPQIAIRLYHEDGTLVQESLATVIQNVENVTEEDVKNAGIAMIAAHLSAQEAKAAEAERVAAVAETVQAMLDKVNAMKVTEQEIETAKIVDITV